MAKEISTGNLLGTLLKIRNKNQNNFLCDIQLANKVSIVLFKNKINTERRRCLLSRRRGSRKQTDYNKVPFFSVLKKKEREHIK